mgnify:CR=1 FL=1
MRRDLVQRELVILLNHQHEKEMTGRNISYEDDKRIKELRNFLDSQHDTVSPTIEPSEQYYKYNGKINTDEVPF